MKNIFTIIMLLIFVGGLTAKNIQFGKIKKEALQESVHPLEKDAKSAILYQEAISKIEYSNSENSFVVKTAYFRRIKIYDAADADLGSVEIPFYQSTAYREKISSLKAVTYNLENGKIEKTKLSNSDIYKEKTASHYKTQKFAMPNIKAGSIFEYKYVLTSPAYSDIPKFRFQYKVPVNESLFTIEVPEYFDFNISSTGTVVLNNSKELVNSKISVASRSTSGVENGSLPTQTGTKFHSIDYSATLHTFQHNNTPSLPDEDFIPYMNNYRTAVKFELLSTNFPDSQTKYYTNTWDKIAELLDNSTRFGSQIRKKLKSDKLIVENTPDEKPINIAKSIYYNIRNKATWNNLYSVQSKDGLGDFLKDFNGTVGDINLLLTNQLQKHGIVAHPVVMRARDYGFMNHSHPSLDDLNYVIVHAEIDGKSYFLDASDKSNLFGNLPPRALNRKGAKIVGERGQLIEIVNPNVNKVQQVVTGKFNEDWSVPLDCKSKYKNYATNRQIAIANQYENMDKWIEELESENENVEYTSITLDVENIDSKGVTLKEEFVLSGIAEEIDSKIYINALMNKNIATNPFVDEKRDYSIFFNSLKDESITYQIELPDGYKVVSLPEEQLVTLPEKLGRFSYSVTNMDNKLVIQSRTKISTDMITPDMYPYFKKLYDVVVAKGKEKIVLSK